MSPPSRESEEHYLLFQKKEENNTASFWTKRVIKPPSVKGGGEVHLLQEAQRDKPIRRERDSGVVVGGIFSSQ